MPTKKDNFGIFWKPDSQTLLVREDFHELVEPVFRAIKWTARNTVLVPPNIRVELQALITSTINECGMEAIAWITWLFQILWRFAPDVADFGAFRVEQPAFIFDHTFGSDTSHRVRIDTS